MRAFEATPAGPQAHLERFEVELLDSLAEQLVELLGGEPQPVDDDLDAFAWLAASEAERVDLDRSDPVIERLFPAAYPDDPGAEADYRRFGDDDARRQRVAQARVVRDDLAATGRGATPLTVSHDHVDAWIKTVNALRLSLSVRLEIVDEQSLQELDALPDRDPRAYVYELYEWLGFVLETLLGAL